MNNNVKEVSATPYDDVFRTLLNDCSRLIIPVINEIFKEHYNGNETILFYPNEHYINGQDGNEQKRITDSCFILQGEKWKKYHLECQSNSDSSLLVRMFEYDTQIALDDGIISNNVLHVEFPNSAVLFLRSDKTVPDTMQISINTPKGEISYDIPVMKTQEYSIEQIFEKKLLFLIPFYIFTHESNFKEYDINVSKFEILKEEYGYIKSRLEELCKAGEINEYTKCTITDMSNKVLENIANKYPNVKKGVKDIMGGQVLDYEAKRILSKGIEEGRKEKETELIKKMLINKINISVIMEVTNMPKETIENMQKELVKQGQIKEVKKGINKGMAR